MKETMCTYIEMLHHQLMNGRPVSEVQRGRLGELILAEPLNPKAFTRAVSLGEPPESVKGMAAARLIENLTRKIGPQADPRSNWLAPSGSPTATDALHIRGYFHTAVNSLLSDAYRANEKFLGRPDPRTVKKSADRSTHSIWDEDLDAIPPLEELEDPTPRLEDIYCNTQYDHCFRALVAAGKDPLQVLYFLCRRLDFMPQEQLTLFTCKTPAQVLTMVEHFLLALDHLDPHWAAPLRSRLPEQWPAGLTARDISNGISRLQKALSAQDLNWYVAA